MISKQLFVDVIEYMRKMDEMSEELQEVFRQNDKLDFCDGAAFRDLGLESYMISILQESMKDNCGYISWWILDRHFGEDAVIVNDKIGEIAFLDTADDLYDFLTKK